MSREREFSGVVVTVVVLLVLDRRGVAECGVQAGGVEPPDPVECGELDVIDVAPGAVEVDALGLVEPDHGLGERVVIAVTDGADRRDRASVGEAIGVTDRRVLSGFNRWMQHRLSSVSVDARRVPRRESASRAPFEVGMRAAVRQPTIRRE